MLQGYELQEFLSETGGTQLCRARRLHDQRVVLLKLLESESPAPEQVASLRREHELFETLNLAELPRALGFVTQGAACAMVLEDRRGEPLERQLVPRRRAGAPAWGSRRCSAS